MSTEYLEFYEDRYRSKHSGGIVRSVTFREAEHLRIETELIKPWVRSSTILIADIGSGGATYLRSHLSVIAIDLSISALDQSGRQLRIQSTAETLPLRDQSVDAVICSQTLEHIPDWKTALGEFGRIVKPNGILFLTVPNRYSLMSRRYHQVERVIDRSGHLHEFRESQLVFDLMVEGFEVVSSRGACYDLFWLFAVLERSRFAARLVPTIDRRIPPTALCRLMRLEGHLRRQRLTGLSLEMVARRS